MRLPITFILFTVFLDAIGVGLILPIMPDLLLEVSGADLGNAAIWGGVLTTSFAVAQFIAGPTIGNLSDRYGRRPVLLVALAAMCIDYLVMAMAGSIFLLLLGRILGGITAATHSTANAYMADISPPDKKAANFGLIGAAFGLGFVVGPILGGMIADFGTRAPFYAAAGMSALNLLFGLFVLPETVKPENRRKFQWKRANPVGAYTALKSLPAVRSLLLISFIFSISHYVYPAIWAYFAKVCFGWDPTMIGISLTIFGLSMAILQGGLMRPILKRLGERNTVIFAFGAEIVALLIIGLLKNQYVAMTLVPIAAIGSIAVPAIQGIMSRNTPDDQQGELQGILSSTNAIGMGISPLVMTGIFAFGTTSSVIHLPGLPFLFAAVLTVLCLYLFINRTMASRTGGDIAN